MLNHTKIFEIHDELGIVQDFEGSEDEVKVFIKESNRRFGEVLFYVERKPYPDELESNEA